jgi:hypothetical protein
MQNSNVLETPMYPNLPKCENDSVGSISRDVADLAWLAGIVDGEGHLGINWSTQHEVLRSGEKKRQFVLRCHIRNTDPFMMKKISDIYHRHNLRFFWKLCKPQKKHHRETIEIIVYTMGALEKLLNLLLPFLVTKKRQGQLILEYLEWRRGLNVPIHHPSPVQSSVLSQK